MIETFIQFDLGFSLFLCILILSYQFLWIKMLLALKTKSMFFLFRIKELRLKARLESKFCIICMQMFIVIFMEFVIFRMTPLKLLWTALNQKIWCSALRALLWLSLWLPGTLCLCSVLSRCLMLKVLFDLLDVLGNVINSE